MPLTVRPAALEVDRPAVIDLLARNLNPAYDAARFDWLYSRNPAGRGRLWVAVDTTTGEIIGTAAAFPRRFTVSGREACCWVLGDFCVSGRYRTLGPALALQRACLALAAETGTAFCYDFPSRAMMTVYQRLRIAPVGQMRRLVKAVRMDWRSTRVTSLPRLARGIASIVQRIVASSRGPRKPVDLAIALHKGPCGEEFSRLWEAETVNYGVCLKRTPDYLNWRYRENPTARHEILAARRRDRLVGYAAFTAEGESALLVDLFGSQDDDVLPALAQAVSDLARQRGCASLSVSLLDSHAWTGMFRRLGFVPREASPLIVSSVPAATGHTLLPVPAGVFLMSGDRDS
jgi:GNAT superfamily N-acetyltransferase